MLTTDKLRDAFTAMARDADADPQAIKRLGDSFDALAHYGVSRPDFDAYVATSGAFVKHALAHAEEIRVDASGRRAFFDDPLGRLEARGADTSFLDDQARREMTHLLRGGFGWSKCFKCELKVDAAIVVLGGAAAAVLLLVAGLLGAVGAALASILAGVGLVTATAAIIITAAAAVAATVIGVTPVALDVALSLTTILVEKLPRAICKQIGECKDDGGEDIPLDPAIAQWDGVQVLLPENGADTSRPHVQIAEEKSDKIALATCNGRQFCLYRGTNNTTYWGYTFRDVWVKFQEAWTDQGGGGLRHQGRPAMLAIGDKIVVAVYSSIELNIVFYAITVPASPPDIDKIKIADDPWDAPSSWERLSVAPVPDGVFARGGCALAIYEGQVFIGFRKVSNRNMLFYHTDEVALGPDTQWTACKDEDVDQSTAGAPAMTVCDGLLWCFYLGRHDDKHHRITYKKYNGNVWTQGYHLSASDHMLSSQNSVSVTSLGERIYLFFRGTGDNEHLYWCVGDWGEWTRDSWKIPTPKEHDGPVVSQPMTLVSPAVTTREPAPGEPVDTGRLFLVYAEKNGRHAGYFDGTLFQSMG